MRGNRTSVGYVSLRPQDTPEKENIDSVARFDVWWPNTPDKTTFPLQMLAPGTANCTDVQFDGINTTDLSRQAAHDRVTIEAQKSKQLEMHQDAVQRVLFNDSTNQNT